MSYCVWGSLWMGLSPLLPTFTCKFEGSTVEQWRGHTPLSVKTGVRVHTYRWQAGLGARPAFRAETGPLRKGETAVKVGAYSSHEPWCRCMCVFKSFPTLHDSSGTVAHQIGQKVEVAAGTVQLENAAELHAENPITLEVVGGSTWEGKHHGNLENKKVQNKKEVWGNLEIPSFCHKVTLNSGGKAEDRWREGWGIWITVDITTEKGAVTFLRTPPIQSFHQLSCVLICGK